MGDDYLLELKSLAFPKRRAFVLAHRSLAAAHWSADSMKNLLSRQDRAWNFRARRQLRILD